MRGFPAKQCLVSQRSWTVNEGVSCSECCRSVLFTLHNLCVRSHWFSESARVKAPHLLNFLFLFLFCFLFVYLFRVGSLDVGVDPNSPARQLLPGRA